MIKYRGIRVRDGGGRVPVYRDKNGEVTELDPAPSQAIVNHSPTGFNWGYFGSGPAQLALALLLDATGDAAVAARYHQEFKFAYVGVWGDQWEITREEIQNWLKIKES